MRFEIPVKSDPHCILICTLLRSHPFNLLFIFPASRLETWADAGFGFDLQNPAGCRIMLYFVPTALRGRLRGRTTRTARDFLSSLNKHRRAIHRTKEGGN